MSISLEQLSAQMRRGEQVPLRHTLQVVLTLSIPSILQQIVVTAMEYIDAAMVGHIGASATASIGIVSSSTWLLHGMLAGLYMSFSIQVAQYLGADRQEDARGVLRQSMLFNLFVGLAAAAFGIGILLLAPEIPAGSQQGDDGDSDSDLADRQGGTTTGLAHAWGGLVLCKVVGTHRTARR